MQYILVSLRSLQSESFHRDLPNRYNSPNASLRAETSPQVSLSIQVRTMFTDLGSSREKLSNSRLVKFKKVLRISNSVDSWPPIRRGNSSIGELDFHGLSSLSRGFDFLEAFSSSWKRRSEHRATAKVSRRPWGGRGQEEGSKDVTHEPCWRTKCRNPAFAVRLNARLGRGDHFLSDGANDHGLRSPGGTLGNEFLPKKQPVRHVFVLVVPCTRHGTATKWKESREN